MISMLGKIELARRLIEVRIIKTPQEYLNILNNDMDPRTWANYLTELAAKELYDQEII